MSTTTSTLPTAAAVTQHTLTLNNEELARVKAALKSKVGHHGKMADDTRFLESERNSHLGLKNEYQALVTRVEAI